MWIVLIKDTKTACVQILNLKDKKEISNEALINIGFITILYFYAEKAQKSMAMLLSNIAETVIL